jgi:nucleoid-associated protein YgaU
LASALRTRKEGSVLSAKGDQQFSQKAKLLQVASRQHLKKLFLRGTFSVAQKASVDVCGNAGEGVNVGAAQGGGKAQVACNTTAQRGTKAWGIVKNAFVGIHKDLLWMISFQAYADGWGNVQKLFESAKVLPV